METTGYLSQFHNLKCSGDVLNVVNPLGKNSVKEITESMAIIKWLKGIVIKQPMKYILYDLCAGNALTGILAAHLLPVEDVYAVDKRDRNRDWSLCQRFSYVNFDIDSNLVNSDLIYPLQSIIVSVHPCTRLANRIVDIYLENSHVEHLIMMPCCEGQKNEVFLNTIPLPIRNKLSRYELWCWQLAEKVGGTFVIDNKVLSSKNGIILASK
jgi:hypothetical protein